MQTRNLFYSRLLLFIQLFIWACRLQCCQCNIVNHLHLLVFPVTSAVLCVYAHSDVTSHTETSTPNMHRSVALLLLVYPLIFRVCCLQTFIDLCRQPVAMYLDRFNFKSPLLKSMYAVTDGFSGLNGSWQTPGTGMNFLMHNMVSDWQQLLKLQLVCSCHAYHHALM